MLRIVCLLVGRFFKGRKMLIAHRITQTVYINAEMRGRVQPSAYQDVEDLINRDLQEHKLSISGLSYDAARGDWHYCVSAAFSEQELALIKDAVQRHV